MVRYYTSSSYLVLTCRELQRAHIRVLTSVHSSTHREGGGNRGSQGHLELGKELPPGREKTTRYYKWFPRKELGQISCQCLNVDVPCNIKFLRYWFA